MDESKKKHWLQKDLWSIHEASWLLCGRDCEKANNAPNSEDSNRAYEAINRAVLAKALRAIDPTDASAGDRMYGHHRFFKPEDVIAWAGDKFPSFPLARVQKAISQDIGKKEEITYLNIIGGLVSLINEKQEAIICNLIDKFPNKQGIKKSTLEQKFAKANRSIGTS